MAGMERVTVEHNGEQFTLEVPEGTTDKQIQDYLAEQTGGSKQVTTPESSIAEPLTDIAAASAIKPTTQLATNIASSAANKLTPGAVIGGITQPFKTIGDASKILQGAMPQVTTPVAGTGVGPIAAEMASRPATFAEIGKHYLTPQNLAKGGAGLVRGAASILTAPESVLAAPYMMAAHEREKINANPNAPEYATNPYAMSVRSQGTQQPMTPGQAGQVNRLMAARNFATAGNPANPQAPAPMPQQPPVQQQPPTAGNFIERMKQLASQYSSLIPGQ